MADYVGWVPTVLGRLSFLTIGTGSFPRKCHRFDTENGFIVVQLRRLLDVQLPHDWLREFVSYRLRRNSGDFWYVMDARICESDDKLSGEIYVVPVKADKKFSKSFKELLDKGEYQKIIEEAGVASKFTVEFTLERRGRVILRPTTTIEKSDIVAGQVFYFLKDISHTHQHHEPKHDSITELVKCTSEDDEESYTKWYEDTLHSLYRVIISFKRRRTQSSLSSAKGILKYAVSFSKLYEERKSKDKAGYQIQELNESIEIAREEKKYKDDMRRLWRSLVITISFALIAAASVNSLVAVNYMKEEAKEYTVSFLITWAAKLFVSYPFYALAILVFGACLLASWICRGDFPLGEKTKAYYSLIQSWRERSQIGLNLFIMLSCIVIAFLMFYYADFLFDVFKRLESAFIEFFYSPR